MNRLRLILAVILSVGILASTTTAAFSQGLMAGSYDIIICSPSGVHEITLGANGEPAPTAHDCQECCFFFADVLESREYHTPKVETSALTSANIRNSVWASRVVKGNLARGPPLVV